jgi:four helix bundle protein
VRDYRKLKVWQKADDLVVQTYAIADQLPRDERYGLASQIKRAAVSVPSNIAEGCGRTSNADFERFLSIAAGSVTELEYQLRLVARMWPSISGTGSAATNAAVVRRMLWNLAQASRLSGRSGI